VPKIETVSADQIPNRGGIEGRRQSYYGRWKDYDMISTPADIKFVVPQFDLITLPFEIKQQLLAKKEQSKKEPVRSASLFTQDDGGTRSMENGRPGNEMYFFGVIDILTEYGVKKKFESFGKSLKYDARTISAINPSQYGERFKKFMVDVVV